MANKISYAAGIDLGGSSVKYALVSDNGECLFQEKISSCAHVSAEAVIEQLTVAAEAVKAYARRHGYTLAGIGIGTPGIVNAGGRTVLGGAENIKGWEQIPLADIMESATGLPVCVGNDANLMGLGETMYGAGKGLSDVLFLTVGTGIGGAVVAGGKLFTGYDGRGMELGHVPLIADGERCACGATGCLEHYASAAALVRRFMQRCKETGTVYPGAETNGEFIVRLYRRGEQPAADCMKEHFEYLGRGIAGFINIFSPQLVVIGGGLSESGDFYIEGIAETARRYAIADCAVNTRFKAASLGNRAGSVGAASLVFAQNHISLT